MTFPLAITIWCKTLSPDWGFMMKLRRRSSNMMVLWGPHCGYLPQITPSGFTCTQAIYILSLKTDTQLTFFIAFTPLGYVFHCISLHWVSVFVYLLVNQLRFQFWKVLILDIIKPMVKHQHLFDCWKHL